MILHQAGLGSVPRSLEDPLASHLANVDGTLHVLIAARDAGAKAHELLGYQSQWSVPDGLAATMPWYVEKGRGQR